MQKNRYFILIIMMVLSVLFIVEPTYAASCDGLLTPGAYDLLQEGLNIIRIIAPALLILLASVDMGTAVISDDKDAMKKAGSRLVKRCIAAIAIFFVPLIVNVLIDMVESSGNITIVEDPMCGLE